MDNEIVFIIMCAFVSLIAIVGGGYFYFQDKRKGQHQTN